MDVCDDQTHSTLTKALHGDAVAAGVPCITTAGIYPGVSNVMAAHMCSLARKEYDLEDLSYREPSAGARGRCAGRCRGALSAVPQSLRTAALSVGAWCPGARAWQRALLCTTA
jgi:saccharopine dehydrogenase-like NADP-dependent oxidoreductase